MRISNLSLALVLAATLTISAGCSRSTSSVDEPVPAARIDISGLRPLATADSKRDILSARRVCSAHLPDGMSVDDLRVDSTHPEILRQWWLDHDKVPYKMIDFHDGRGGIGCLIWVAAQPAKGQPWEFVYAGSW